MFFSGLPYGRVWLCVLAKFLCLLTSLWDVIDILICTKIFLKINCFLQMLWQESWAPDSYHFFWPMYFPVYFQISHLVTVPWTHPQHQENYQYLCRPNPLEVKNLEIVSSWIPAPSTTPPPPPCLTSSQPSSNTRHTNQSSSQIIKQVLLRTLCILLHEVQTINNHCFWNDCNDENLCQW